MKFNLFILKIQLKLIIIIYISSFSFSQISSSVPLYKIVLTRNITNLRQYYYHLIIDLKGVGIIINNSSNISVMPSHIYNTIYKFYVEIYEDMLARIEKLENGYNEFIIAYPLDRLETMNFILTDFGISFPITQLFLLKNVSKNIYYYRFRFLSREGQDNIIFGKDLIETMEIDFTENNDNFAFNNKSFNLIAEDD